MMRKHLIKDTIRFYFVLFVTFFLLSFMFGFIDIALGSLSILQLFQWSLVCATFTPILFILLSFLEC